MPQLHIINDEQELVLDVPKGSNLRRVLLDNEISPYTHVTRIANCGGRGLCATCGVWVEAGEPAPQHWHDKLANSFGYPRLSCQITIEADMTVRILHDKRFWGHRDPKRAGNLAP